MSEAMPVAGVGRLAPLSLAEVEARARLQQRIDRKYVVPIETVERLVDAVASTHGVLEIAGLRTFRYSTWYFDSETLRTYRAHVQGRRNRFKIRTRTYLDSGLCRLEVKLKGLRGETVKLAEERAQEFHGVFDADAGRFLAHCLRDHPELATVEPMRRSVEVAYRRTTLVMPEGHERLTVDVDLSYAGPEGEARLLPGFAIVESKSTRGLGTADRLLRSLGARPLECSKYCVGVAVTRPDVAAHRFLRLQRRYFESLVSPAAASLTRAAA